MNHLFKLDEDCEQCVRDGEQCLDCYESAQEIMRDEMIDRAMDERRMERGGWF